MPVHQLCIRNAPLDFQGGQEVLVWDWIFFTTLMREIFSENVKRRKKKFPGNNGDFFTLPLMARVIFSPENNFLPPLGNLMVHPLGHCIAGLSNLAVNQNRGNLCLEISDQMGAACAIRWILNNSPGSVHSNCTDLFHHNEGTWSRSISLRCMHDSPVKQNRIS